MKTKVMVGLLLAGQIFSAQATALACIGTKSGGLYWENSEWKSTVFKLTGREQKFILKVSQDNNLDKESVRKAMDIPGVHGLNCSELHDISSSWSCSSYLGDTLILSKKTLQGGMTSIYGATQSDSETRKDTISVTTFKCEKF